MDRLKFKLYPRELVFSLFIIMLPASLAIEKNFHWEFAAYTDEILCILCGFYIILLAFKRGIKGSDFALIVLLIICIVWGLIGNAVSRLITDTIPILIDVICLAKMFFPFIIYKQVAHYDKKKLIIKYLTPIAKLTIILGTFFGTISLFVNIGMSGEKRYGIPSFSFIFQNEARYGYIIACCLLVIYIAEKKANKCKFYAFLSVISMIYTTKGVVYIIVATYLVLSIMWKKSDKLTVGNVIVAFIGMVSVSLLQIETYLKDLDSPRMRLLRYGLKTANTYFPLGSGFATYGSDQAARHYSPIYKLYGFNNLYGLSMEDPRFLNDCYFGMVFGQFGYIGTIIFIIMIVMVFLPINKITLGKNIKALSIAIFVGLIISSLGTAIIKSSIGVFTFAILGTICGYSTQSTNNNTNTTTLQTSRVKVKWI